MLLHSDNGTSNITELNLERKRREKKPPLMSRKEANMLKQI
jgi:hypothetical protein